MSVLSMGCGVEWRVCGGGWGGVKRGCNLIFNHPFCLSFFFSFPPSIFLLWVEERGREGRGGRRREGKGEEGRVEEKEKKEKKEEKEEKEEKEKMKER